MEENTNKSEKKFNMPNMAKREKLVSVRSLKKPKLEESTFSLDKMSVSVSADKTEPEDIPSEITNTENEIHKENKETEKFFEPEEKSAVQEESVVEEKTAEFIHSDNPGHNPEDIKTQEIPPKALVFDWIKTFIFSLITVIFVFTFLVCGVTVDGESMNNTLQDKDYLLITKLFYTPKTGDIVVLKCPQHRNEPLIKRVIATSGQKVKINFLTWEVSVDGVVLDESYVLKQYSPIMNNEHLEVDANGCAEITVDEGCVFVMGDNRNNSLDSRSNDIGQIYEGYIMGKVILRILPFDQFGGVE